MARRIPRREGRRLFGRNPEEYDRVRSDYPPEIYRILRNRCGLAPGTSVFEIGAGTGKASRELLRQGANPLTVIEPDPRLVRFLRSSLAPWRRRVRFVATPFEDAELPSGAYDLGVAATSFHWLSERTALRKVARLLRPGGWWAAWWSLSGDPFHPNAFKKAADHLFRDLPGEHNPRTTERVVYARGRKRRIAALRSVGPFDRIGWRTVHWARKLDTPTLVGLHRTFSNISTLPAPTRRWFLTALRNLADEEFGGEVTMRMVATIYTARRR